MNSSKIPFNKPFIIGRELDYIQQAVASGHLAGDGMFTKKCHAWLEQRFGTNKALLTHSCTAALEMAAILSEVAPGDEVILPSYTFVSTANAFALRGAQLRFVDIRRDTLNLDESLVEAAITGRTRVIVPVHYAGVACEMDAICRMAERHGLLVVEDAAQAVNATYRGRWLGAIGNLGCYSFHETKNFICGEGGALAINDSRFLERAEIIWEKGTNRSKFFRGEVDKYTWVDIGSSYLASELAAAFLWGQLEAAEQISRHRRQMWSLYRSALQPLADSGKIGLPTIPAHCGHNAHLFYILLPDAKVRDHLIRHLKEHGIRTVFHYVPLHNSPMGLRLSEGKPVKLPVTENLSERVLRLPCYYELSEEEQMRVVQGISEFFTRFPISRS